MLISGSFLFAGFSISVNLWDKYLDIPWKYWTLRLSLLFFLIPYTMIKELIQRWIYAIFPHVFPAMVSMSGKEEVILISNDRIQLSLLLQLETIITVLWLLVGSCIFFFRIREYYKQRIYIQKHMQKVDDSTIQQIAEFYCRKLKIRRRVNFYFCEENYSAFTIGFWNPLVVIPPKLNLRQQELVLQHELYHIKSGDTCYGFIRLWALSIYWFYPPIYWLDHDIERISELYCDRKVIKGKSGTEKREYGHLIISMIPVESTSYMTALKKQKNIIEERLVCIMRERKETKKGHLLSLALGCMLMIGSSIPVLAYDGVTVWRDNIELSYDTTYAFTVGSEPEVEKILFDRQFTATDGTLYPVNEFTQQQRACEHVYESGQYSEHKKHSDGSCTVHQYSAKRCKYCGQITDKKLISSTNYVTCPH